MSDMETTHCKWKSFFFPRSYSKR